MRNIPGTFFPAHSVSLSLLTAGLLLVLSAFASAQDNEDRVVESDTHRFVEMADGVWQVTGTGSVYTMSNAMVLVGEFDVLVVDSHVTPAAATALLESINVITDLPVRYLVNSHYHFDHAHGNQSFPNNVEIIGHTYTRDKLSGRSGNVLEEATFKSFTEGIPATVARLAEQAANESNPARKAQLQEMHRVQNEYMISTREVRPTPPNITLEKEMTLFQVVARGSREIQLLHFGRGHTGGDVVIYLPQERVVFTGDFLLPSLSYMGDGFVNDWPASLEGLKSLDFDIVLPGHGAPVKGKEKIGHFQAYLTDLWGKTEALKNQGLSAEEAAEKIDLSNHSGNYAQIRGPGADVRAIRRIYQLLDNPE